jgi:hypothetical protein
MTSKHTNGNRSERTDFYRVVSEYARARAIKDVKQEPAIRLYCEQFGAQWNLQVRALRASGSHYGKGKEFFVSTAPMNRDDLIALREAIDALLAESEQ